MFKVKQCKINIKKACEVIKQSKMLKQKSEGEIEEKGVEESRYRGRKVMAVGSQKFSSFRVHNRLSGIWKRRNTQI